MPSQCLAGGHTLPQHPQGGQAAHCHHPGQSQAWGQGWQEPCEHTQSRAGAEPSWSPPRAGSAPIASSVLPAKVRAR